MTGQIERKVWANRSQQTIGNVMIRFSEQHIRQVKSDQRFAPVLVQRVYGNTRISQRVYEELIVADREKQAATGRWVLHAIAAQEAYEQVFKTNQNNFQSNKKRHSFFTRKFSKVKPIEISPQLFKNQNINPFPQQIMIKPTTINNGQITSLSNFSTATSTNHVRTIERSNISSRIRSNSQLEDDSTEEFQDGKEHPCINKRIKITFTILSIILIIGIIITVLITIFVGRSK